MRLCSLEGALLKGSSGWAWCQSFVRTLKEVDASAFVTECNVID